jgi:hypothetical protein
MARKPKFKTQRNYSRPPSPVKRLRLHARRHGIKVVRVAGLTERYLYDAYAMVDEFAEIAKHRNEVLFDMSQSPETGIALLLQYVPDENG